VAIRGQAINAGPLRHVDQIGRHLPVGEAGLFVGEREVQLIGPPIGDDRKTVQRSAPSNRIIRRFMASLR
jgi:hypothetical protein